MGAGAAVSAKDKKPRPVTGYSVRRACGRESFETVDSNDGCDFGWRLQSIM